MPLIEPHTGRTGDALKNQVRLAFMPLKRAHERLLEFGMVKQTQLPDLFRQTIPNPLRQCLAVPVILHQARSNNSLAYRLATRAAHRPELTVDLYRKSCPFCHRLTTVKADRLGLHG